MTDMARRDFIKLVGAGVGGALVSSLFHDRLLAGTVAAGGGEVLSRFGVAREDLRKILHTALSKGGDFADLYFEYKVSNSVVMEDDIVKRSAENVTLGVGVRVLHGKQTGFGYTSDLSLEKIQRAALTAASIAASGARVKLPPLQESKLPLDLYEKNRLFCEAPLEDRIALVREGYAAALAHDPRIVKASASLADEIQYVTIVNSEGLMVSDTRPQVRLTVTATAQEGKLRNTGNGNAGGRVGRAFFQGRYAPKEIGVRAATEALTLLTAADPAAGEQPVVLGCRQSGVMVHEAVGHPFEGEGIWAKTSIVWDKLGQMVASPAVTIYDDATLPFLRGSLNVDDEGTPTQKVTLIEKGKLTGYLLDRLSARILGMKPNGHGRRESYSFPPICRMNNTMLEKGEASPEDVIKSVKKGFYADSYFGGQVEDTGKFTFSVNLGYMIEDGKLTRPVKNATLIGTNVNVLKDIELVGNDTEYFLGTCGKDGQSAAVTAGTPSFKIRQMTVGGRI